MAYQRNDLKKLFEIRPHSYKPQSEKCGILYKKGTKEIIPLQSISYQIEILDSLAFISLTQNYFNDSPNPIETEYFFSISDNACFYEFQAEIDGQIMVGKIKEKQEAKAEYEHNKAQGNIVAYSETNKEIQDVMKINIGNVPPKKSIRVTFGFLQELDICLNKFWKLLIPSTLTPRYLSSSQNQESMNLLDLNEYQNLNFPQAKKGYQWTINVIINSMTEVSFIRSPTHDIIITNLDNFSTKFQIQLKNSEIPNKDFTLLFRNKSLNQTKISLAEINDEENPFCAMINFMPDFNPSNDEDAYHAFQSNSAKTDYEVNLLNAKGEYIFLLDRSGSMANNRIKMATEALMIFLKSLPPDSYFNIIGFGSRYEKLFQTSLKTNENLITDSLFQISEFQADLGGTEIYSPLKEALNSANINQYPKNIFILTDGEVSDVVNILTLIAENNDLSKVYTIGVGNGCSREIIVEGAKLGKGKHEFISETEDMNEKIIGLLEDSITPFLSDFKMNYDTNLINIIAPVPESLNFLRKNEEFRIFAFLNKQFSQQRQTFIQLQYYDSILKKNISQQIGIHINDLVIQKDYLHKYGAFQVIRRIQRNLNYERDFKSDIYLAKKDNLESYCLNFALKYQILTPFTSFICVIKQNFGSPFTQTEKIIIPTIESIDSQEKKTVEINFVGGAARGGSNLDQSKKSSYGGAARGGSNLNKLKKSFQRVDALDMDLFGRMSVNSNVKQTFVTGGLIQSANLCFSQRDSSFLEKKSNKIQTPQAKKEHWLSIVEKQKMQGFWEFNEENARYVGKELQQLKDSIPIPFSQNPNLSQLLWITCLVLFFLDTFHKEKMGSYKLIWKKGEQWMKINGFDYQMFKETAKIFFFGAGFKQSSQIALIKQCKCGKTLNYVRNIPAYNGEFFCCDKCAANNLISGGVFHCESCQFDLCEECNNEQIIKCSLCKNALKFMTDIPQTEYQEKYWCDVCTKENNIMNGVYHCIGCGKYDMCITCKGIR